MMRWTLNNPSTGATWTFLRNPDKMTSPHIPKTLAIRPSPLGGVARAMHLRDDPYEWSFSGKIAENESDQYLNLLKWTQDPSQVVLTDHLGRQFLVRFTTKTFTELRPSPRFKIRYTYEIRALIYQRLA